LLARLNRVIFYIAGISKLYKLKIQ